MKGVSVDLRGALVPVSLLVVAELAARHFHLQSDMLAAPSDIFTAGFAALADGSMMISTFQTLASAAGGLVIGFGLGLALGVLTGLAKRLDQLLEVTIELLRPVPPVALIPIALLVYGFGYRMEIVIVAFATVWPALIFSRSAISGVEPRLFEVARSLQLPLSGTIFKIAIPAATPRIFVALRLATGISLIVAVTVEITSNTIGLGHAMMEAGQSLQPALMLAHLVWIGIIGLLINWLMLLAQSRLFGVAANLEAGR